MTLYIPNVVRYEDTILVSFRKMDLPDASLSASRKFQHLYKAARDSDEHSPGAPVLTIDGAPHIMEKEYAVERWSLNVPSRSDFSISYLGLYYECGGV